MYGCAWLQVVSACPPPLSFCLCCFLVLLHPTHLLQRNIHTDTNVNNNININKRSLQKVYGAPLGCLAQQSIQTIIPATAERTDLLKTNIFLSRYNIHFIYIRHRKVMQFGNVCDRPWQTGHNFSPSFLTQLPPLSFSSSVQRDQKQVKSIKTHDSHDNLAHLRDLFHLSWQRGNHPLLTDEWSRVCIPEDGCPQHEQEQLVHSHRHTQ